MNTKGYIPFSTIENNDKYSIDLNYAANKVMSNAKINRFFHFLTDTPFELDINKSDVLSFLVKIYNIRNKRDSTNNLDILTYNANDKSRTPFKLNRSYFYEIYLNIFEDFEYFDVQLDEKSNGDAYIWFINPENGHDYMKVKMGNGSTAKGNAGDYFEKTLCDEINDFISGNDEYEINEETANLVETIEDNNGSSIVSAELTNTQNTHRFTDFVKAVLDNEELDALDCGEQISDITLNFKDGSKEYLSLKKFNGDRLSNLGITSVSKLDKDDIPKTTEKFYKMFNFDANRIKYLLETIYGGEDYEPEVNVYDYSEDDPVQDEFKEFIASFIAFSLGYNYWYVKEGKDDIIETTFIDKDVVDSLKKNFIDSVKEIDFEYPKSSSKTTQIRIIKDNDEKRSDNILIQFKNTNSGLYPNKMMLIYPKLSDDLAEAINK